MSRLWVTPEEMGDAGKSVYAYEASRTASFMLWALSGRKYTGTSTITERYECPCRRSRSRYRYRYAEQLGLFDIEPYLYPDEIACGCTGMIGRTHAQLRLRGRPVRSVSRVSRDGEEIDPGQYQLVNASVLQAAPGASLDVCGLEVTYTYGIEPPTAGRRAARYLATELAKHFAGEPCELPERVTSVSRQGVTLTVLDDHAFLDDQRTGVYAVDLFLKTVNPDKARKPARVFSPDVPKAHRLPRQGAGPAGPTDLRIVPGEEFTWRYSLQGASADLFTEDDWRPQGQISSWSGAILFEAQPGRFEVVNDELVLRLSGSETSRINITGSGSWDLYALNADGSTVIHVMSSSVALVGPNQSSHLVF